ncbi:hypothetical protein Ddye_000023 [Dipteronia dyeriana]|uniref:Endonuclease/exonuclease/phosphatase n=1 Tax=Dipteronia dyeriana TaxID=168575 RepID=A0AAE0CS71_9ROSI|nr:hypothetical protein Ddye_000023 [Dipteronia dyeriana]
MDIAEIMKLYASLSLKEREGPVHRLHDGLKVAGAQKLALCLAGKILSLDLVNRESFQSMIARIWKVQKGVEIEISNILMLCMTKDIGYYLGNMLGDVREVDVGSSSDCLGKFLRVRIAILIDKPLRRFLRVDVLCDEEVRKYKHQFLREADGDKGLRVVDQNKASFGKFLDNDNLRTRSALGSDNQWIDMDLISKSKDSQYSMGNDEGKEVDLEIMENLVVGNGICEVGSLYRSLKVVRSPSETVGQDNSNSDMGSYVKSVVQDCCFIGEGFYGNPESSQRVHAWSLIRRLKGMSNLPWLCLGDFNEILSGSEKIGGSVHPLFLMENFREALDYCELNDLGYSGLGFTWSNKRDYGLIQERLDRGVCNFAWQQLFPARTVTNLGFWSSDHRVLLINIPDGSRLGSRDPVGWRRRFHYEACWVDDVDCRKLIEDS